MMSIDLNVHLALIYLELHVVCCSLVATFFCILLHSGVHVVFGYLFDIVMNKWIAIQHLYHMITNMFFLTSR